MPIYQESYQSWEGRLIPKPKTFWVIARTGIFRLWKKGMILFILLAYLPFIFKAVQIFIASRVGGDSEIVQAVKGLQVNPEFFYNFLKGQMFLLILILIFSGAGLIANDRRFKALTIYFSKPVSYLDYIGGKGLVVLFYGSLITLVPCLLLFLLQVLLARDLTFFNNYFWIPLACVGYTLIALSTLGGFVMALSATCKTMRSAAIYYFAFLIFPDIFRSILSKVPEVGLFSLYADIYQVGSQLFGLKLPYSFSVWASAGILFLVNVGFFWILKWRIRPTEVVK